MDFFRVKHFDLRDFSTSFYFLKMTTRNRITMRLAMKMPKRRKKKATRTTETTRVKKVRF